MEDAKQDNINVSARSYKDRMMVFDETDLNGFYSLDLAHPYERYVAETLAREAIETKGECWLGECVDGNVFNLDENADPNEIEEYLPSEGVLELTFRSEKTGMKRILSPSLSDCIISAFCLRQHETACAHLGRQNDAAVNSRKVLCVVVQPYSCIDLQFVCCLFS